MASMRICFASFEVNLLIQTSFFGKAVLGLIQAFSFNWLYFEIGMGLRVRVIDHAELYF